MSSNSPSFCHLSKLVGSPCTLHFGVLLNRGAARESIWILESVERTFDLSQSEEAVKKKQVVRMFRKGPRSTQAIFSTMAFFQ